MANFALLTLNIHSSVKPLSIRQELGTLLICFHGMLQLHPSCHRVYFIFMNSSLACQIADAQKKLVHEKSVTGKNYR